MQEARCPAEAAPSRKAAHGRRIVQRRRRHAEPAQSGEAACGRCVVVVVVFVVVFGELPGGGMQRRLQAERLLAEGALLLLCSLLCSLLMSLVCLLLLLLERYPAEAAPSRKAAWGRHAVVGMFVVVVVVVWRVAHRR